MPVSCPKLSGEKAVGSTPNSPGEPLNKTVAVCPQMIPVDAWLSAAKPSPSIHVFTQ